MAALACYFDDSTSGDEQIHIVAGYLAPVDVWDNYFAPAWNNVLRNAPHPITEFKASDCMAGQEQFRPPWTEPQRIKLRSDLITVIKRFPIFAGVASVYFWPGKIDPAQPRVSKHRHRVAVGSYGVNVGLCLMNAFAVAEQVLSGVDTVQPVFDRKNKFWHRVHMNFEHARKKVGPELSRRIKFPIEEHEPLPALQAADLLAHEILQEVIRRCDKQRPRRALQRLFAGPTPYMASCVDFPPLPAYNLIRKLGGKPRPRTWFLFGTGKSLRAPGFWGCRPTPRNKSQPIERASRFR